MLTLLFYVTYVGNNSICDKMRKKSSPEAYLSCLLAMKLHSYTKNILFNCQNTSASPIVQNEDSKTSILNRIEVITKAALEPAEGYFNP